MTNASPPVSLPPQYHGLAQRAAANRLGLWTFLATEVLLFGGLFAGYAVYRHAYPAAFAAGSRLLDFGIGTANTAVLLTSSLCVALGDRAVRLGDRAGLRRWLAAAMALGVGFLVLKGYEYHQKYVEHLVPGPGFRYPGAWMPQLQLFLFFYFAMTGLHALHMIIGLGVLAWALLRHARGGAAPVHPGAVEISGLYWHFVDCVWVFLYPLLYLISGR